MLQQELILSKLLINLEGGGQDFSLIAEGFDSGTLSAVDFEKNDIIRLYSDANNESLFFDLPSSFVPNEIVIYDTTGKAVRVVSMTR
jgi:hypothetical protein